MDLITLSVGVNEHTRKATYEEVALWSSQFADAGTYVNVNHVSVDNYDEDEDTETDEGCEHEHLYVDDQTMIKVRAALINGLTDPVQATLGDSEIPTDIIVDNIINRLQNAGILFRERDQD